MQTRTVVVPALVLSAIVLGTGCGRAVDEEPAEAASVSAELRSRGKACASSDDCGARKYCTTENGECMRPPGCRRGEPCATVCYGVCEPRKNSPPPPPATCGSVTCAAGQVCCNPSCGICTPPDGVCTQQVCEPTSECTADADCRTFSDYCTGCDCRALASSEPDPVCPGPGVRCFADPCMGQVAHCAAGTCALRSP